MSGAIPQLAQSDKSIALYLKTHYTLSMETKLLTIVRLSAEAKRLVALLANRLSISQSAALELAIRAMAKREGVK